MADQRRYSQEQVNRVVQSGEQAPDLPWYSRLARNAAVAVPRALTDTVAAAGMVVPAIQAGLSSEVDFPEAMYGKEGVAKLQDYVQTQSQKEFDKLPEERRTDKNWEAITSAIANSDAAERIRLEAGPINTKMGTEAGNALNDLVGLKPVRSETFTDDAEQIAASALLPSALVTKPLQIAEKAATTGLTRGLTKAARVAADVIVPGTAKYTPGGIAANAGAQAGISQGLRYATDQPSLVTGDALAADNGVDAAYAPALPDPDADEHAGMGGEQLGAAAGIAGGVAVAAAVLSGKANRLVSKAIIDQLDSGPLPKASEALDPTLTGFQKFKSGAADSSAPIRDTLRNFDVDEDAVKEVERIVTNTANVNMNTAHQIAMDTGNIPGLDRKSVPLTSVQRTLAELPIRDQELFNQAMTAKTLLDQHALKLKSADDELRDARMGIKNADQAQMAKVKAIEAKKTQLESENAPLGANMSVREGRQIASQMDQIPQLVQIEAALRKLSSDIIDAKVKDGQITELAAQRMRASHPNHMMLQEDPDAGKSGMGKWWNYVKRAAAGTKEASMYGNVRGPLLARDAIEGVQNPKSALDSFKQYLYDHVQYTKQNDATRAYVKAMKGSGGYGRAIREVDSMSLDEFHAKGEASKVKGRNDIFAYTDKGRIHFMEAADPETLRALQFSAPATLAGANLMRKIFQQGTTGIASPEFGPTAALFEDGIARMTRQPGRSYGIVDATLRRAFPNSTALSSVLDKFGGTPLPLIQTSHLQMVAGLFQQIRYNDIKMAGQKIADDLAHQSGIFHMLSKLPGGQATLQAASEALIRSYNESRYGVFVNEGIKQSNLLDDPLRDAREGYAAASHAMRSATAPVRSLFKHYVNTLEMIHNSSKYAFFAQNLAALERKYKGKVPKAELDKLVGETKSLSGDMTRSVGNPTLSKTLSAFPYAQVAVNSSYQLASAIKHDPINVGSRILTGAVMPKIGAIALISSIPALSQWYWNEIPAWQRLSTIPVIGPDWWIDLANGKQRAATPEDIYLMREAPELSFITNPITSALRAMGAYGSNPQAEASFGRELGEGMENITSVAAPPALTAILGGAKVDLGRVITSPLTGKSIMDDAYNDNPHQGFNTTGINADSDISRGFSNVITALFGTAVNNILSSVDTAAQGLQDGHSVAESFARAFQYNTYKQEMRLPEMPGTREAGAFLFTNGMRRHYASTQERERVVETLQAFEPVAKQLSVDKDKSGANMRAEAEGMDGLRTIQDPKVRAVAQQMYTTLEKGKMFKLTTMRTDLNKDLARLEANKENMSPRTYHEKQVAIMEEMNSINKQQDDIIMMLDSTLLHQHGVDIRGAIEVIGQSLGR